MFRILTLFVFTEVPGFYEKLSGKFFLTYELYLKQQKTQHFNTPKLWSQMLPERFLKIRKTTFSNCVFNFIFTMETSFFQVKIETAIIILYTVQC
jgi:hypothetical protein